MKKQRETHEQNHIKPLKMFISVKASMALKLEDV